VKDRRFEAGNPIAKLHDVVQFIGELQVRKRKFLQFQVGILLLFFKSFKTSIRLTLPIFEPIKTDIGLLLLLEHFGQQFYNSWIVHEMVNSEPNKTFRNYIFCSIVNLLGVDVARLFSCELDAGEQHTFEWNNHTGLPDGVYECLIRMNGQVETLPMVLLH
jgi:hypothetical protein